MNRSQIDIQGLSDAQVLQSGSLNGSSSNEIEEDRVLQHIFKEAILQPMFILLLAACIIYFFVGQYLDGIIMLVSIFIVAGISLYQECRSQNAIQALPPCLFCHYCLFLLCRSYSTSAHYHFLI
jgi:Ca2+-transporting ATPase